MSHKRLTTWQKATALVPLALLSGAWTASLTVTPVATAVSAGAEADRGNGSPLPDGTSIPNQAIEAPASVSAPGSLASGVPAAAAQTVAQGSSTNGIPAAALAAYQRSEQVINSADPSCNMQWELLAAIGRVESDHGRYGGNTLNSDGKSVPGIYGIPLDGSNGTARITDSDAGQYDDDGVFDRAVGPMQFIPSTWTVVGVDGDGDDERDPQDIDDASLASAVYLCSGEENLATDAGRQSAVYRYNHSQEYVELVLAIMESYQTGDYSAVPNGVAAPTVLTPSGIGSAAASESGTNRGADTKGGRGGAANVGGGGGGGDDAVTGGGSSSDDGGTSGAVGGNGDDGGGGGGDNDSPDPTPTPPAPSPEPPSDPVKETVDKVKEPVEDATEDVKKPVDDVTNDVKDGGQDGGTQGGGTTDTLTKAEATARCEAQGISKLDVTAMAACVSKFLG